VGGCGVGLGVRVGRAGVSCGCPQQRPPLSTEAAAPACAPGQQCTACRRPSRARALHGCPQAVDSVPAQVAYWLALARGLLALLTINAGARAMPPPHPVHPPARWRTSACKAQRPLPALPALQRWLAAA